MSQIYRKKPNTSRHQENRIINQNSNQKSIPLNTSSINIDQKNWIGDLTTNSINLQQPKQDRHDPLQLNPDGFSKLTAISKKSHFQSPLDKLAASMYKNNSRVQSDRSPTQLMNDIFRGIGLNISKQSSSYYSKDSEQALSEILSSKNKYSQYIKKLTSQLPGLQPKVQKNYQILILLLQQVSASNLQVVTDQNGFKLNFNRDELIQKQKQIQRLQKQLQQKNKQTQKIVQEYQGVIRNFNDVMEKLIHQKKY